MEERMERLRGRLAQVTDLTYAAAVLSWDQETMMPSRGAGARADQLATLQALAHRVFTDEETGRLLEELAPWARSLPFDSDDAAVVRVAERDFARRSRVPAALVEDLARTTSLGKQAWRAAREARDFAAFRPDLERILELRVRWAECFAPFANPYDPLLDAFEPGMTQAHVAELFQGLRPHLVRLAAAARENAAAVDGSVLRRPVPEAVQVAFSRHVTARLGYDYQRGRLDLSAHPFSIRFGPDDVRITTRVQREEPLAALLGSIHEAGHAMHAQALRPALYRTSLDIGAMQALSESQSRFWENVIGRSRPFWSWLFPELQRAFAPAFDDVSELQVQRAVNEVRAGPIRVEADEVTYGLHIMLRFELENELINGRLDVGRLPREWDDRMEAYLGIRPAHDAEGVLQDIHWAMGAIGYFPDYLLGSVFAVQLWDRLRQDLPAAEALVARGEFAPLLGWLQERIMQHGRAYTLPELSERVVGGPLRWEPYVAYLEERYGSLYGA